MWMSEVVVAVAIIVLHSSDPASQSCRHSAEAATERVRRQRAVDFAPAEVNSAQARHHWRRRIWTLTELQLTEATPVGFIPRLLLHHDGYALRMTDMFDPCSFTVFTDSRGVIFEASDGIDTAARLTANEGALEGILPSSRWVFLERPSLPQPLRR